MVQRSACSTRAIACISFRSVYYTHLDGEQVEPNIDSGSEVITIDNAQERLDTLDEQLGS